MAIKLAFHQDGIAAFDGIFPASFCKKLIDTYRTGWGKISLYKEYEVIFLFDQKIMESCQEYKEINLRIPQYYAMAIEQYSLLYNQIKISRNIECKLTRYTKGYHATKHWDYFEGRDLPTPTISCSILLNDNYKGGKLAFHINNNEIMVPNKTGRVIIWPSHKKYIHEVKKIRAGTRYSIVAWFI